MIAPEVIWAYRNAGLAHLTVLFLGLTGLADGLAPKERRYAAVRFAPTTWAPRFLPPG